MENPIDTIVNFFSPEAGLKRTRSRIARGIITNRNYDVASKSRRTSGWFRPETKGSEEVSKAFRIAANSAQELCRNNPLARRSRNVWSGNIVGGGISLEITAQSKLKSKNINSVWEEWAESTECDFESHNTLYGLQDLWVKTIVESGGVFIKNHVDRNSKFPLKLQTIEQSFLDLSKEGQNEKGVAVDGIQFDKKGKLIGYWFVVNETSKTLLGKKESKFHKAENIIHIYRKDRAGQHIGITWFHGVANHLKNYDVYQDAKLMQQQIAACFALIVEEAESAMSTGSNNSDELPDTIEPAMVEYVKSGQKVTTVTPPKADSSSNFDIGIKRDIAAGLDLTYEMLTGDYSLVNFASGRMGKSEFFNQLDNHQKNMMKPALDKVFKWFLVFYELNNVRGEYTIDWTFPSRAAVNPQEEFDVLMSKVRHGMLSPTKAAKILGEKLPKIIEQWKKDKEMFGDLPFDIDPSIYASTGNQLNVDAAASSNKITTKPKDVKNTVKPNKGK